MMGHARGGQEEGRREGQVSRRPQVQEAPNTDEPVRCPVACMHGGKRKAPCCRPAPHRRARSGPMGRGGEGSALSVGHPSSWPRVAPAGLLPAGCWRTAGWLRPSRNSAPRVALWQGAMLCARCCPGADLLRLWGNSSRVLAMAQRSWILMAPLTLTIRRCAHQGPTMCQRLADALRMCA